MSKVFLLISPKNRTVYNFRGDLIRRIQLYGYEVHVTGPDEDAIDSVLALGVKFHLIPMEKNGTDPRSDLKYEKLLHGLCEEIKPDVVLAYTAKPVCYGCHAAYAAGVPHVYALITGVGYAFTADTVKAKLVRTALVKLYKRALAHTDAVIFQNFDNRHLFEKLGLVKGVKSYVVAGSGVNTEYFAPAPLPKTLSFFMLSRLLYSKGIREYLDAARIVKKSHPEIQFKLLGNIQEMPDALGASELAPYLDEGIVTRYDETSDVRPFYTESSVFVLPSYGEGTPRTVLEAMAMGRPIVTTDAPGCKETVVSGVNGFLVEPKSVTSLVGALMKFVDDPLLVESMGDKSRELVEKKYDVEIVNADMITILGIETV